jgi:FPC/CPF motif-containing protein YcgG
MKTEKEKNSIGGSFILKTTTPEDVFTPEDFSEEQRMMKEAVMRLQKNSWRKLGRLVF